MYYRFLKHCFFILVIVAVSHAVYACDTSLIIILTDISPEKEFFTQLKQMSFTTADMGALLSTANSEPKNHINELMRQWLEFEKQFRFNPPDWNVNEEQWHERFNLVARQIGSIRKFLRLNDRLKAHRNTLRLSRKLNLFILEFEVSDIAALLIRIPLVINEIKDALEQQNKEKLWQSAQQIATINKSMKKAVDEKNWDYYSELSDTLTVFVNYVEESDDEGLFSWLINITISRIEEVYSKTNDLLLESGKNLMEK